MVEYEWDEAKNRTNIAKHGISVELARQIFDGRIRIISARPANRKERRRYHDEVYKALGRA